MRRLLLVAVVLAGVVLYNQAEKRALGHEDFDGWQNVVNEQVSRQGDWAAYEVNPQAGDGFLYFHSTKGDKEVKIARGYRPAFTADGKYGIALVKPKYSVTRDAKIAKKKDHEMPKDSLLIVDLKTLGVTKIGNVLKYTTAKDGGEWIAWESCDTAYISAKKLADKDGGRPVVVRHLSSGVEKVIKNVKEWKFSRDGKKMAFTIVKEKKDTLTTSSVGVIFFPDTSYIVLDRDKKWYGVPQFSYAGDKLAFTCSDDSVKTGTKMTQIMVSDLSRPMHSVKDIKISFTDSQGSQLLPNQYTTLSFSRNGKRLIAGVAPVIAPDDTTIVDFEQGKLDIWRWDAPMTPPKEKNMLDKIRKVSLPVAIDLSSDKSVLLSDNMYEQVKGANEWDGEWALILDPTENIVSDQWTYFAPTKMYVKNVNSGEKRYVGECMREEPGIISPSGKYVAWFTDRQWNIYEIATGKVVKAGKDVPTPLWDTLDEHPAPSVPWGVAGWSKDDERFLVYDQYDIWSLDPKGADKSENITMNSGKKHNLKIRYLNTDTERRYLSAGDLMLLTLYDYEDHYYGLGWTKYGKVADPKLNVLDGHSYTRIRQAKESAVFTWQRGNFSEIPEIWVSYGTSFEKARRLTGVNSQLDSIRWGTAQLERWYAYDGKPSEGVLYVPENLDPDKKYPMLCVFYETGSEDLYSHYRMEPSWSWVNYPFYVSRGYVVFVPDIHYTSGRPGEDAYNYVCSGAEEMCRRYPWIDKDKIGIDGQSWGGYQTAFLVTRTNMFACAGSGAPVANMTSAYGGIRWESGDSRQGQYEMGQSRIGGTLWDKTEAYIQNSPVFFANRVETPLLIMHNDNDGAVPWYQGIEMFMALRRLQKPVWMLQYNGESHNIRDRKNRKDITKRLQQFFDHYLKDAPMPKWMKEGVPMIRKGQEFGF